MAYFMLSILPYHSAQLLDLSTKTIALNELEQRAKKFTDEAGYVFYSKVLMVLKSIGFDIHLP